MIFYDFPDADFGSVRLSTPEPGCGIPSPGQGSILPADPDDEKQARFAQIAFKTSAGKVRQLLDGRDIHFQTPGFQLDGKRWWNVFNKGEVTIADRFIPRLQTVVLARTMEWYDRNFHNNMAYGNPDLLVVAEVDSFNIWPRRQRGKRLPVLVISPEDSKLADEILKLDEEILNLRAEAELFAPLPIFENLKTQIEFTAQRLAQRKAELARQL